MSKEKDISTKDKKEDDIMAITARPNEATIIKKDMLVAFINELCANKPSEEYWSECEQSKSIFSSSDIDKMKKIFDSGSN